MIEDIAERLRVGLIGDPVAHSLSPAIQQAAFDALAIPATYELWPTPAADLPARLASLRQSNILGANVTVPHKLAVMPLLDEISPLAHRVGAVNTIIQRDGRLLGDNTDVAGFATALSEACPDAAARPALILGAGGAARAVILALESIGAGPIAIANRAADRACQLADDLDRPTLHLVGWDPAALSQAVTAASLLINATSVGWHGDESPIELDLIHRLPGNAFVVDLTYRDTALLRAAHARGLSTLDGLPMLVHQGARAFELWTHCPAPIAAMLAAARAARC